MALDPRILPGSPDESTAMRLADAQRRISTLERSPRIQTGSGAPTNAVQDGTPYVDTAASLYYMRSGGTWKSAALT